MSHHSRTRRALPSALPAICLAVAAVIAPAPAAHTAHAASCAVARPYSLPAVVSDKAWADAHGLIGPMEHVDGAAYEFTLVLTAQQAEYLQESIDGGCTPQVSYSTRGTVVRIGTSAAWFDGEAQVSIDGSPIGEVRHAGSFPLASGCLNALSCQENLTHTADVTVAAPAGTAVTVTGSGSATALVLVPNQFHQAHADFWIRYPVLRIPIP